MALNGWVSLLIYFLTDADRTDISSLKLSNTDAQALLWYTNINYQAFREWKLPSRLKNSITQINLI